MKKCLLMTPGPTPVPPQVYQSFTQPIVHHRTPEFRELFKEVVEALKYVFQTQNPVLVFASSGTGGMEGAVSNILSSGEEVVVVKGGKFGERWEEICRAYGVKVIPVEVEWGEAVDPSRIKSILEEDKEGRIKAVFTTLCETSTGVVHDIKSIGEIVKGRQSLLVVDAISGLGAEELRTDDWGVDVAVSCSQKGLMLPPGLAFVSVGERAWERVAKSTLPKYYFDFAKARKSLGGGETPYTPAISLLVGLKESLRLIKEEGLENVFQRHRRLAQATRAGVKTLGLELFSKAPANAVTAVKVPSSVDGAALVKVMEKEYGVKVAGGQASLKGKIFRIAHLGFMEAADIIITLSALEMSLESLGYKVERGAAVRSAEEILRR